MKKILSIVLSVLGIALFMYGSTMSGEAAFKEGKVSQAEATNQSRPTLGPVRRAARTQESENKQKMLGKEEQKIASAQVTATWFKSAGAVLFIAGVGSLIFFSKRKNSRR